MKSMTRKCSCGKWSPPERVTVTIQSADPKVKLPKLIKVWAIVKCPKCGRAFSGMMWMNVEG